MVLSLSAVSKPVFSYTRMNMAIRLGDLLYRQEQARTPEEAHRLQTAIDDLYEALGLDRSREKETPNSH